MKNVWSSWAAFDRDGNCIWSKEDTLRQRYGKMCRGCTAGNATTGKVRLFQNSMTNSLEPTMTLSKVRMERVLNIRAAIANGSYNVSSAELAQKLIGNMLGNFR